MWVRVRRRDAVAIHDEVVRGILNIYPEEKLLNRPLFANAFAAGHISYKELLAECDSIFVPWQMFFLTPNNLKKQLDHIDSQRAYKFNKRFFVKREGVGRHTSKRIIDRLVRLQSFILKNYLLPKNQFCGLLKASTREQCVGKFLDFFEIDTVLFRSRSVEGALKYLIERVGSKQINISRGVLKGGVLPELHDVSNVYKNTSGFVVKDDCIPFIFLPDAANPEEAMGRRIYTLVYLLVCIGLDEYDFYLESQFKASALRKKGRESFRHDVTTAILLPEEETESLRGTFISDVEVADLSKRYKITPTAVVVILRRRGILSKERYDALLPRYVREKRTLKSRRPGVITAVKRFCGDQAFTYINEGIRNKRLASIEAQYLLFGRVYQKAYKIYCREIQL